MKKTLVLFSLFLLNIPLFAFAAGPAVYKPLISLPNGINANSDFNGYINSLYIFSITIAALLAVIKIIIAGVKWMLTDVVTSKGEAKKDIQGALIGLLIVLSAVLILTVVNPDTVNVELKLPGQVNPPYTGSAAAPTALDPTKITTKNLGSGVTASYQTANASNEQKILFKNSCPLSSAKKFFSVNGDNVCITRPLGTNASLAQHCTDSTCTTRITNVVSDCTDNKKGTYVEDTKNIGYGYCIY